ncbi:hypothetical protein Bca52824_065646 [Brassica carinata]|uniref:Uncharacterized protein n=1 Tax=Brassica carinata TaxID=52824 RepID=A0A8X7QIX3_BRACI|nr:hypothetical protein Bca52824_065646 [Brassica carinata]
MIEEATIDLPFDSTRATGRAVPRRRGDPRRGRDSAIEDSHRERGLSSYHRGATKRKRIVDSSTIHGERLPFRRRATERGSRAVSSRRSTGKRDSDSPS